MQVARHGAIALGNGQRRAGTVCRIDQHDAVSGIIDSRIERKAQIIDLADQIADGFTLLSMVSVFFSPALSVMLIVPRATPAPPLSELRSVASLTICSFKSLPSLEVDATFAVIPSLSAVFVPSAFAAIKLLVVRPVVSVSCNPVRDAL